MLHKSWIITALSFFTLSTLMAAEPLSAPPVISNEDLQKAQTLWNEGMEAFVARHYSQAATSLTTYLDKYAGLTHGVEARFYLAQSLLFSKKPEESIKPFQSYIEAAGHLPQVNEARIYLGNAYLDLKKHTEAYLVSEELLTQNELPSTVRAKALMLRAHAQSGLKQNIEAEKTLSVFQGLADSDPELERELASSYLVTLLLKSNHCDALPSSKTLPEDQLLDQLNRKGLCILEMSNQLMHASKRIDGEDLKSAVEALESSWKLLMQNCETPPLERGKRNQTQYKKAKEELADKLKESCSSTTKLLQQSLQTRENLRSYLIRFISKDATSG